MHVQTKEAVIVPVVDESDTGPGTFEAILSSPTKDRDGDTLLPGEWKQPLPEHITVDMDHGMSVASTIGSARPWLDADGNLRISGTFASTPQAQQVRTLVREGHVRTTSVAFLTEKSAAKDGRPGITRELLNAALVAIPSNREAVVLAVKQLTEKDGARNSAADLDRLQAIHDGAVALGASCSTEGSTPPDPEAKSAPDSDAELWDAFLRTQGVAH